MRGHQKFMYEVPYQMNQVDDVEQNQDLHCQIVM